MASCCRNVCFLVAVMTVLATCVFLPGVVLMDVKPWDLALGGVSPTSFSPTAHSNQVLVGSHRWRGELLSWAGETLEGSALSPYPFL